jgi:hypothetical protein
MAAHIKRDLYSEVTSRILAELELELERGAGPDSAGSPRQLRRSGGSPWTRPSRRRWLVALRIDTDRCDQDQILVHVNAVDLDHQQIKAGEVRSAAVAEEPEQHQEEV